MTSDSAAVPAADQSQAALWNGRSGQAWVDTQALLDALFRPIAERLIEAVPTGAPLRVLDVGCGTGAVALAIAQRLAAHGQVTGVDISAPMIAAAEARAAREGIAATFVCADAQRHAFAPSALDRIVSRFGVMFFDDPAAAFANLQRAASVGASLHAIAWRGPAENPFMTVVERSAAALLPALAPRLADAPGPFGLADAARTRALLGAASWTGITITPLDVECVLPLADLPTYFTRIGPLGGIWAGLDEETRRRVAAAVQAGFAPYVRGDRVHMPAACWEIGACAA